MTTNGKGSLGDPGLGIQNKEGLNIRTNHQYYLDNKKYRREDTPAYMLLVHCTCPTCGYEVTFPISYSNVGFSLSPLPGTPSESASTQTPMRSTQWEVVTLALRRG